MSALIGSSTEIVVPSGLLSNRSIALNNQTWARFIAGHFLITTSATPGNRIPFFNFRDSAANVVFQCCQGGNVAASLAAHFNLGPGVNTALVLPVTAATTVFSIAIPASLVLPPNAVLFTGDFFNIDMASDAITGALVITY